MWFEACHCWVHLKTFLCIRIAQFQFEFRLKLLQVQACLSMSGQFVKPACFSGAWRAHGKELELCLLLELLDILHKLWDNLTQVDWRVRGTKGGTKGQKEGGIGSSVTPPSHQRRKTASECNFVMATHFCSQPSPYIHVWVPGKVRAASKVERAFTEHSRKH